MDNNCSKLTVHMVCWDSGCTNSVLLSFVDVDILGLHFVASGVMHKLLLFCLQLSDSGFWSPYMQLLNASFWVTSDSVFAQNLNSDSASLGFSLLSICSLRTHTWWMSFIFLALWSCTLEQTLAYPIDLFNTLLSSKLFKGLNYQNLFCSNTRFCNSKTSVLWIH